MSLSLVITIVGPDRAGLVSAVSDTIAAHGGAWMDSRLARLAGQFAGVVRAVVPKVQADAAEAALRKLEGLSVNVMRGDVAEEPRSRRLRLRLNGLDRPGIVRDATRALSALGVNIVEFESALRAAPFSGLPLFHAEAVLEAPETVTGESIRDALEALSDELSAEFPEAALTLDAQD